MARDQDSIPYCRPTLGDCLGSQIWHIHGKGPRFHTLLPTHSGRLFGKPNLAHTWQGTKIPYLTADPLWEIVWEAKSGTYMARDQDSIPYCRPTLGECLGSQIWHIHGKGPRFHTLLPTHSGRVFG